MHSAVPIIRECAPCITIKQLNGMEKPRSPQDVTAVPSSGDPVVTLSYDSSTQIGTEALVSFFSPL